MKKIPLFLLLSLLVPFAAMAQEAYAVYTTDGIYTLHGAPERVYHQVGHFNPEGVHQVKTNNNKHNNNLIKNQKQL